MYKTLSTIQKQKYLELSGEEFSGPAFRGRFMTSKPYNDPEYKLSPWDFSFIFDDSKGYLVCELAHRMTNNRTYGWDYEGNELSSDINSKYFRCDVSNLKIIKRGQ